MRQPRAVTDKRYEEKHKEERKAKSLVWGTSVPRQFAKEINEFLSIRFYESTTNRINLDKLAVARRKDNMTTVEIIGQIIGIFGVIALLSAYQMNNKKSLLLLQMFGVALMSTQYFLINALSGAVLNLVCLVRTVFFYITDGKIKNKLLNKYVFPSIFSLLICVLGVFFWEGWYTSLILVCLAVNSFCTGACNPQNFRKSLLFTCALAFAYDIVVFSISGIINETVSFISSVVGIIRYRKKLKDPETAQAVE